jgi:hypothetical protein
LKRVDVLFTPAHEAVYGKFPDDTPLRLNTVVPVNVADGQTHGKKGRVPASSNVPTPVVVAPTARGTPTNVDPAISTAINRRFMR